MYREVFLIYAGCLWITLAEAVKRYIKKTWPGQVFIYLARANFYLYAFIVSLLGIRGGQFFFTYV